MKKILFIISVLASTSFLISSCVKNADNFTDFQDIKPLLELKTGLAVGGGANLTDIAGLANFGNSALSAIPNFFDDTISWYVNLASEYTLKKDITVTVGIQPELITVYNSDTTHLQYELMPDSDYVWAGDVTVTIPAGQRTALITGLQFNYDKIDPSKNYMLPIGIKNGDGLIVSANQGAIYFHAIGNPLAGTYSQEWRRWSSADSARTPDFDEDLSPALFAPINATTISAVSGTGITYLLSFKNNSGVLSGFTLTIDPASAAGITITGGPTIIVADPITNTYKFYFAYNNSSGAPRIITDEYKK